MPATERSRTILLAGASTRTGREFRHVLSDVGDLPGVRLLLRDPEGQEGLLTEFRGEPALSSGWSPLDLQEAGLAVFCGPLGIHAGEAAGAGIRTILLEPPAGQVLSAPLVHTGFRFPRAEELCVRGPCLAASLVLSLTSPLRPFGLREIEGTILLPASWRGEEAVKELLEQVQARLSFQPPATRVFGRVSAFDLFPLPEEAAIASREVEEASGIAPGAARLHVIQAPLFHAAGLCLGVLLERGSAADAETALHAAPDLGYDAQASPGAAGEAEGFLVGSVRQGPGAGRISLWAAADNIRFGAAANALRIARAWLLPAP